MQPAAPATTVTEPVLRTIPYSVTIHERTHFNGEFPVTKRILDAINAQAENGLPYALAAAPFVNSSGGFTGKLMMQNICEIDRNVDNCDILILVKQGNDFAIVNLLRHRETPNCMRQFQTACKNEKLSKQNQTAEAQILTSLRFLTGSDFEKSEEKFAQFALLATSNGNRLAFYYYKKFSPDTPLNETNTPFVRAIDKYPLGQKVNNAMLAIRELLLDIPGATVSNIVIQASGQFQATDERREGNSNYEIVVKRTFKISVFGKSADGEFEIVREHDATLRPYRKSVCRERDGHARALKIGDFMSKFWGLEIKAALNPNHPNHSFFSRHIDALTVSPDLLSKTFYHKDNYAIDGQLPGYDGENTGWFSMGNYTYEDLIKSSSTKIEYSRNGDSLKVAVPKSVETY